MNPAERVRGAYERIAAVDRPEVWISLRPLADVLAEAAAVAERVQGGEELPLAGLTVAVKDNIDVGGLPTTAACPAFAYQPRGSAPAVARLCQAGAVVLGKTNMDQFATGLVGTRTPYGAVRDARRLDYVAGGSSSGSAVAVALGVADIGLGTDTAGSGRVPAAFQGIVGAKPTRGLVPTAGVVPACRTLDCVSVFTRELGLAQAALGVLARPPARAWPADAPLGAPPGAVIGVPNALPGLSEAARERFTNAVARLRRAGHTLVEVNIEPFLAAGRLLYEGAFVAERYAAVGSFVKRHPHEVDATVGAIISGAAGVAASALVADGERLEHLRVQAEAALAGAHALLVPTTTAQPRIDDVGADPLGVNARLGTYTNCANLLDLCAVAVPAGEADGGCFGVTLLGRAFADALVAELAADLVLGDEDGRGVPGPALSPPRVELFVVGAHRLGQPLNAELTARGARMLRAIATAPEYRLHRLRTDPPKPGLLRVEQGGASVEGELWALPPAGLAELVAALPAPMALGRVRLRDGSEPIGFLCEPAALEGTEDITAWGSWTSYRQLAGV